MTQLETLQEVVGYKVVVERYTAAVATVEETYHWRGSRSTLHRRAMMKPRVKRVVSLSPINLQQWNAMFGDPSLKRES